MEYIPQRDVFKTKQISEQCNNQSKKGKKTKEKSEKESGIAVFDDMLDSNQKAMDPFFTRRRQEHSENFYLSQSFFDLPKTTMRKEGQHICFFKQSFKEPENSVETWLEFI